MVNLNKILFGLMVSTAVAGTGLQFYGIIRGSRDVNQPIYRDVNGDKVDDKIVERKVEEKGFFGLPYKDFKDETLFGIEVDGKRLYLPKEQFEEYKR